MRKEILICAALSALAARAVAQRPDRPGSAESAWKLLAERHDADHDGRITRAEYGRGDRAFARLDRNRDGVVTIEDLGAGGRGRERSADVAGMRGELLGPLARAADADDDEVLTSEEWRSWLAHFETKGSIGRQDLELAGASGPRGQQLLRMLDSDRDRTLSLDEARAAFGMLDADGDGTLRGDELGPPLPARPPRVGQPAPDFELPTLADPEVTVRLSSFRGDRPVALIFGSYT